MTVVEQLRKIAEFLQQSLGAVEYAPVCAKNVEQNQISYKCFDCGKSHDSHLICINCFELDLHRGHRYVRCAKRPGCCDCGDEDALTKQSFCKKHSKLRHPPKERLDHQKLLEIKAVIRLIVREVIKTSLQIECCRVSRQLELNFTMQPYFESMIQLLNQLINHPQFDFLQVKYAIVQVLKEQYKGPVTHRCQAESLAEFSTQWEQHECHCQNMDLLLRVVFPPKAIASTLFYGLFKIAELKTQVHLSYLKNSQFLLMNPLSSSLLSLFYQFFNSRSIELMVEKGYFRSVAKAHRELVNQLSLQTDHQVIEKRLEMLLNISRIYQFYCRCCTSVRKHVVLVSIVQSILSIFVQPIIRKEPYQRIYRYQLYICQNLFFIFIQLIPYLQSLNCLPQVIGMAFQALRTYLSFEISEQSNCINSFAVRLWAVLRYWLYLHFPDSHRSYLAKIIKASQDQLELLEYKGFKRTLYNLTRCANAMSSEVNGQIYRFNYIQFKHRGLFWGDTFAIRTFLLFSSNPKMVAQLFATHPLPRFTLSSILLDQLPANLFMARSKDKPCGLLNATCDWPIKSLVATIFNYQTKKDVKLIRSKLDSFVKQQINIDQVLRSVVELVENCKFQLSPEAAPLYDLFYVKYQPMLSEYESIGRSRKESGSLIYSGYLHYLIQHREIPSSTILLLEHLLAVCAEFPLLLIEAMGRVNDRQESLFLMRPLWVLNMLGRLSGREWASRLPQQMQEHLPFLEGRVVEIETKSPVKATKRQKIKNNYHKRRQQFISAHKQQVKHQPVVLPPTRQTCVICLDQDNVQMYCYIIRSTFIEQSCVDLQFCEHRTHLGCIRRTICPYCKFIGNAVMVQPSIITCFVQSQKQEVLQMQAMEIDSIQEAFGIFLHKDTINKFAVVNINEVNISLKYLCQNEETQKVIVPKLMTSLLKLLPFRRVNQKEKFVSSLMAYHKLFYFSTQPSDLLCHSQSRLRELWQAGDFDALFEEYVDLSAKILTLSTVFGIKLPKLHCKLACLMIRAIQVSMLAELGEQKLSFQSFQHKDTFKLKSYKHYAIISFVLNLGADAKLPYNYHNDEPSKLALLYACETFCDSPFLKLSNLEPRDFLFKARLFQEEFPVFKKFKNYYDFHKQFYELTCKQCEGKAQIIRSMCLECQACLCIGPELHFNACHKGEGYEVELNSGMLNLWTRKIKLQEQSLFISKAGLPFNQSQSDWESQVVNPSLLDQISNLKRDCSLKDYIFRKLQLT